MANQSIYSKDNIIEMKWYEAIRRRPGMYIGRTNLKGFTDLLMGIFTSVLSSTNSNFASIDLMEHSSAILRIENIKNRFLNTWSQWKPNPTNPFVSELETLNALSKDFKIKFLDKKGEKIEEQVFEKGVLTSGKIDLHYIDCITAQIEFTLDKEIWGESFVWNEIFISYQIREFAYLHKKVKIELKYLFDSEECRIIYHFKNGLKSRLDIEKFKGLGDCYFETKIDAKIEHIYIEAAFAFRDYNVDEPFLKSYVNDYYTHENGTHIDGLLKGLTHGVMKYFQKYNLTDSYKISEKGIKENLIVILNIRIDAPIFSGCVKNKLANFEIIEPIANYVATLFFNIIEENKEATQKLIRKFKI